MRFKEITLTRGMCYGACPAYSVTIHRDGLELLPSDRMVTCTSSHSLTVTYEDGSSKCLEHVDGEERAPKELLWLERRIDAIAGTKAYVGKVSF